MNRALMVLSAAAILASPTAFGGQPNDLPTFEVVAQNLQSLALPTTGHETAQLGRHLALSEGEFLALREAQLDLLLFQPPTNGPLNLHDPAAVEVRVHAFTEVFTRLAQRLDSRSRALLKAHLEDLPVTVHGQLRLPPEVAPVYSRFDDYWSAQ